MSLYRIFLVGGLALALATGGLAFWKRKGIAYRVKSYRAASHLEKSVAAGKEGDWQQAERLAMAAWQLRPGDVAILRQVFASGESIGSSHLLATGYSLFHHPDATPADRVEVLDFLLRIGDVVRFRQLLTQLPKEELRQPDGLALAVRFSLARNDFGRALGLCQELREARGNDRDRLLEAETLSRVAHLGNAQSEEAQKVIAELFTKKPEIALRAFALLRNIPDSTLNPARFGAAQDKLLEWESEGIEVPLTDHLLAVRLQMLADPAQAESLAADAIERFGREHTMAVGEWLLDTGHPEAISRLVPETEKALSSDEFALLLRRDIDTENWEAAKAKLAHPHPGMPPAAAYSLQAMVAEKTGNRGEAETRWEQALNHATLSSGRAMLLKLAEFARASGNLEICERALKECLLRPSPVALPTSDVSFLFSALAEQGDSTNLLTISRLQLQSEPDNPTLRNNVIWLELIRGHGANGKFSPIARDLVGRFPEIPTLRTTLGLALVEEGSPAEAEAAVGSLLGNGGAPDSLSDTDKAVLALVLQATGQAEESTRHAESVDWKRMMPEERDFLRSRLGLPAWKPDGRS